MQDNAQKLMQQSMMGGKYHGTLVTYSVTFMWGMGEIIGMEYFMDDVQTMETVEAELMMP